MVGAASDLFSCCGRQKAHVAMVLAYAPQYLLYFVEVVDSVVVTVESLVGSVVETVANL